MNIRLIRARRGIQDRLIVDVEHPQLVDIVIVHVGLLIATNFETLRPQVWSVNFPLRGRAVASDPEPISICTITEITVRVFRRKQRAAEDGGATLIVVVRFGWPRVVAEVV